MRTNFWLEKRLEHIWARYFADVERITPIKIIFGRRSYRRLGSITLRPGIHQGKRIEYAQITISSLLIDSSVPDIIIDQILAHEIVHYFHGFGSHYPRRLRHPHQGGVILKEFHKRGIWELYRAYQAWMKIYWLNFLKDAKLN